MLGDLLPELARSRPGELASERPGAARRDQPGRAGAGGLPALAGPAGAGRRGRRRGTAPAPGSLQFDEPINIQYTSGTTGFPKGATLSHYNILNNGYMVGESLGLGAKTAW